MLNSIYWMGKYFKIVFLWHENDMTLSLYDFVTIYVALFLTPLLNM